MTIGEVDAQGLQPLLVNVTLNQARGFLTNLSSFTQTGPGTYQFAGTAAAATTAIRGLAYDPIENRITVPTNETTTFMISVTDGIVAHPTTNSETTITVIATNDPPIIAGTLPNQTVYQRCTIKPFSSVTVTEVDDLPLQPLRVTVAFDATHGFLSSLDGFVDLGGGVYQLGTTNTGVTAAAASQGFAGVGLQSDHSRPRDAHCARDNALCHHG